MSKRNKKKRKSRLENQSATADTAVCSLQADKEDFLSFITDCRPWCHILNGLPRKPLCTNKCRTPASAHRLWAGSWMRRTEMLSGLREDVWGVGVGELRGFTVLMQLTARKAECWLCRFEPATDGYGAKYWPHGLIKKITSGTSRRGQR